MNRFVCDLYKKFDKKVGGVVQRKIPAGALDITAKEAEEETVVTIRASDALKKGCALATDASADVGLWMPPAVTPE